MAVRGDDAPPPQYETAVTRRQRNLWNWPSREEFYVGLPPGRRVSKLRGVVLVYGALAAVAIFTGVLNDRPNLLFPMPHQFSSSLTAAFASLVFGVVLAAIVISLSRLAIAATKWGRHLYDEFCHLLGPMSRFEVLVLALTSSFAEELLFRGALLPVIGNIMQAGIFALLHVGPDRRFLPWTVSSLLVGLAFGAIAQSTGSLLGPITAHFLINWMNLGFIARSSIPVAPVSRSS